MLPGNSAGPVPPAAAAAASLTAGSGVPRTVGYILEINEYEKSPANANGNAQQSQCMFECPVKQSLSQLPKVARRRAVSVYSVLLVLTRGRDGSRSVNAVSAGYRKFSLPPSRLVPSFGVTPFELMERLYGS